VLSLSTVHTAWFKQVRLDPKHYWDRQVGPYQFEFQLDQYETGPSTYAYFIWPATFFMSANLLPPLEDPHRKACVRKLVRPSSQP